MCRLLIELKYGASVDDHVEGFQLDGGEIIAM